MTRLALRSMSRHKGRTALIVTLIALPVAIGLVAAGLVRLLEHAGFEEGTADQIVEKVHLYSYEPFRVSSELDSVLLGPQQIETELGEIPRVRIDSGHGLIATAAAPLLLVSIQTFDPANPLWPTDNELIEGIAPQGVSQVALSEELANLLAVTVGDRVEMSGLDGQLTVTGIVHARFDHDAKRVLLGPEVHGDDDLWARTEWHLAARTPAASTLKRRGLVETRDSFDSYQAVFEDPTFVAFLVNTGLLFFTGLLIASAFATANRRRIYEFGMLSAVGADSRHVRLVALTEAAMLGLVGSVIGVLLGIGGFLVAGKPFIESLAGRDIDPTFAIRDVGLAVVMGVTAAALAAYLPARTVARVPATTALAGRVPLSAPRRWTAPLGIAAVALGITLVASAGDDSDDTAALFVLIGVAATFVGAALLAGPVIALLGRIAHLLPVGWRLVVRDNDRQRTRAAAATGALTAMFIIPTFALAMIETNNATYADDPGADEGHADVSRQRRILLVIGSPGATTESVVATVKPLLPLATATPIQSADGSLMAVDNSYSEEAFNWGASILVWSEDLGDALGLAETSRPSVDQAVLLAPYGPGAEALSWRWSIRTESSETPIEVALRSNSTSAHEVLLISPEMASASSLADGPPTALILLDEEPDNDAIATLQRLSWASQSGISLGNNERLPTINYEGYSPYHPSASSLQQTKLFVVLGALISCLLVLSVTAALVATESDHDLATMVAVGAVPRTRRDFLARQSWLNATVAAVIALPVALVGGWVTWSSDSWSTPFVVPWYDIGLLVIGTPLVASAIIWLAMRSRPVTPLRRLD